MSQSDTLHRAGLGRAALLVSSIAFLGAYACGSAPDGSTDPTRAESDAGSSVGFHLPYGDASPEAASDDSSDAGAVPTSTQTAPTPTSTSTSPTPTPTDTNPAPTTTAPAPTTTTTAPAPTTTTTAPAPTTTTTAPAPTATTPTPAPTTTTTAPAPTATTPPPAPTATTPTPAPTATTPPPAPTTSTTEYAPYFYAWGWGDSSYGFTSLVDLRKKAGTKAATLAFVLGSGNCTTTRDIQSNLADVKAFVSGGGHVKASFGGASGTYLENTCSSASAMQAALEAFVDETGITDLDFDVEQAVAETSTVNARRAQALAAVQKSRGVKVAFTLPATPSGISSEVVPVVQSALAAGVSISHVNLMTMDYGSGAGKMGAYAVSGATGCASQLQSMIPGLSSAAAYAMVGITPMIGQNDVSSEVFTLADAQSVVAFAKSKHVGLLSFWAIQRDRPCGGTVDLASCSNAETSTFQYDAIFETATQ